MHESKNNSCCECLLTLAVCRSFILSYCNSNALAVQLTDLSPIAMSAHLELPWHVGPFGIGHLQLAPIAVHPQMLVRMLLHLHVYTHTCAHYMLTGVHVLLI